MSNFKLNKKDFINILKFYKIDHHSNDSLNSIKIKAEKIIGEKLCSCIKKVDPNLSDESKAIAICTNSILNKKGLNLNKFSCKKRIKINFSKKNNIPKNNGKLLF